MTPTEPSAGSQPLTESHGRLNTHARRQATSAQAKQSAPASINAIAGWLAGYALLGLILLILAAPPAVLLGLGLLALASALFNLVGVVQALYAVVGGNGGDLATVLTQLAQLDVAIRVGLLCAAFYGLLFALMSLLGGVLGPRRLRFYIAPGALATLTALLLFLAAVVFVAPVAASVGVTTPWRTAFAIYALLDVVILAVGLADTRQPLPRRRRTHRQDARRQARPAMDPALVSAPRYPPPNFSLQATPATPMLAFTLPSASSPAYEPASQPLSQPGAPLETPEAPQPITAPEASQPHLSAFVVTRRELEPTPQPHPLPSPSSALTQQPIQATPAIENHDIAQIETAIVPVLSVARQQRQE
ncbi:MAG: hypothetical protein ABI068_05540 [Ktedonobacterales bacterium]